MKAQVTCNIQLPPYITAVLYNDGFVIKVTRQISKDAVEDLQETLKYFGKIKAEVFNYRGHAYISCNKLYSWGYNKELNDFLYPTHPYVLSEAKRIHRFIMERIINWKITKLEEQLDQLSNNN